jgi:serine/threonine-protein kinase
VTLVVSSGTAQVPVPRVRGLTQAEAVKRLTGAGLTVVVQSSPEGGGSGRVSAQQPRAGTKVGPGSQTTLTVGGAGQIKVPSVTGQSEEQAVKTLSGAGLAVTVAVQPTGEAGADGRVRAQRPHAGTQMGRGGGVTVVVSRVPARARLRAGGARGP